MSDLTLQQLKALRFWQTPEITNLNRMPHTRRCIVIAHLPMRR